MAEENTGVKKKKKRRKKHYFLRFMLFIALFAGAIFALRSELFNVNTFVVSGNHYYTSAQIQEMSGLTTGVNMFKQKTKVAVKTLLEDPYIKTANIKRVPMSTIKIDIEEREEFASIPYGDKYLLIDNEGMVLRVSDELPVLTLLEDMEINESVPGKPLEIEQRYLLTNTLELLNVMKENDLFFKKIKFSSVIVKAYIYDDLYCEGTPEHISSQMSSIKRLVEEQFTKGVTRGVIKVGKDNYIAFSPKID